MDNQKNIIAAIALSSAVIVLYSLFFIPDQPSKEQILAEKEKIESTETPKIEKTETKKDISRQDAIQSSKRIVFENDNIMGSISLTNGGAIDDFTKVIEINPKDAKYSELNDGDIARLYSGRGEVALKVEVTDKV